MIKKDQPASLPPDMVVGLSSYEDGDMNFKGAIEAEVESNRERFLSSLNIKLAQTALVCIDYDRADNNYSRLAVIEPVTLGVSMEKWHDTAVVDALATDQVDRAAFLPVGDCCPVVLADRESPAFMLAHMGRHNVEQNMGFEAVKFMDEKFGVKPENLSVWLGPAVGKASYPLYSFDGLSLHEVISDQLRSAGLTDQQMEISQVDTAIDQNYFSHSEFKAGRRLKNGRFAVVAMRRSS